MPVSVNLMSPPPAVARLASLWPLDRDAGLALERALQQPRRIRAGRELLSEGREITEAFLILSGWAARVRILEDGRRQIINFLLPGDLIGLCSQERPLAVSTVVAVTEVHACVAPDANGSVALAKTYAHSRALEEAYLLCQITRLGRLTAYERIADLFLELLERLERVGLAADGRFPMPATQEMIADAVGLSAVHVNRTLQALRRNDLIQWKGGQLHLTNPAVLARSIGRSPVKVTAG